VPAALLALLGLVGIATGVHGLLGDRYLAAAPSPAAPSPAARPSSCATAPRGSNAPAGTGVRTGEVPVDLDGDGCTERVTWRDGTLVVAGAAYRLGVAGDVLRFGDWDGDGIATPALLRPSTGAVFAFDAWPAPGRPLVAHPVAHVAGATGASVATAADGHDRLVVRRRSGPPVPLDLDPTRGAGRTSGPEHP
jgi:hypothetical protein